MKRDQPDARVPALHRQSPWTARDGRWMLALALIAAAAFAPVLWTGFSSDDFLILSRLQDIDGLAHPLTYFQQRFFEYYRPLTLLSFALDYRVWGLNATGFHATSLCLHAANTALVFALGRRFMGSAGAAIAALLFGTRPAAHETVYWIAARFDLLATLLILVSFLLLSRDDARARAGGLLAFGLALLTKETAVVVPVLIAANEVILRGAGVRALSRRLVPLVAVAAGYVLLRAQAPDLALAGGAGRGPKLAVLVASLAALFWMAHAKPAQEAGPDARPRRLWQAGILLLTLGAGLLLLLAPPTEAWMRQKLGFVAYAAFYLLSPVAFPPPAPTFFAPDTVLGSIPGLLAAACGVALTWASLPWLRRHPAAAFLAVFVAVSLIPVLSLTGSPRYIYLASAGLSVLAGFCFEHLSRRATRLAIPALALVLVMAVPQLVAAASAWTWGARMVSDGVSLMTADRSACGQDDVLLLTAPVGIRGVYANFYWDALKIAGCAPASFSALLRVVRVDAHVEVEERPDGTLELRVPAYRGTFTASSDLRHFDVPLEGSPRVTIETTAGRLETWPTAEAQVFRLTPTEGTKRARLYYYSDGALHAFRR